MAKWCRVIINPPEAQLNIKTNRRTDEQTKKTQKSKPTKWTKETPQQTKNGQTNGLTNTQKAN